MNKQHKTLGIFALVMINVIAVDSLRSLPISAQYGFSLVFFYLIASLCFFIPTALVSAELATGWPTTGGIYVWIRAAFNARIGFLAIWLQWIYNLIWYPTILSFVAATIAYLFKPALGNNPHYQIIMVLSLFWLSTGLNCFGMRTSKLVSALGAILGTLLPMLLIILLGGIWLWQGSPLQLIFSWKTFLPNHAVMDNLAFFLGILFGLVGLEMSAVHAGDVKNPARDYPRALFYSVLLIVFTLVFAALAIAMIVPHHELSLVSGLIEAFMLFFRALHMPWMGPVIVILIILGAFAGVSAWIIGPTRGLLVAAKENVSLPAWLLHTNRHGAPVAILLIQGLIFTILCSTFIIFPTVNSAYWLLTTMTSQLALLEYILLFVAAIKLRHSHASVRRAFHVPGGKLGLWSVCLLGIITCLVAIVLGFFPPLDLHIKNVTQYEMVLFIGIILFSLPALILPLRK